MVLLRDVVARTGTALVVVTHDAEVAGSCHRTLALRDGRAVLPRPPPRCRRKATVPQRGCRKWPSCNAGRRWSA
jgi:ABC-type lipoprotein export system ATPase subunit